MRHWSLLLESDERFRNLEREYQAAPDDEEIRQAYHTALERQDRHGDVMGDLVHRAGHAYHAWNEARRKDGDEDTYKETLARMHKTKQAVNDYRNTHRIHPAEHIRRFENETPRQFAERLMHHSHGASVRFGREGGSHHGTMSWDDYPEHSHNHKQKMNHTKAAWEREVPGGKAKTGLRTRLDRETGNQRVVGSYVHLHTPEEE